MNEGGCQKEDQQGPWRGRELNLPEGILNLKISSVGVQILNI